MVEVMVSNPASGLGRIGGRLRAIRAFVSEQLMVVEKIPATVPDPDPKKKGRGVNHSSDQAIASFF
jgi:hypothetical protein